MGEPSAAGESAHKKAEEQGEEEEAKAEEEAAETPSSKRRESSVLGGHSFNKRFHYYRFVVVTLGGFSAGLMCLMRYNISIAMLKMVNQTHVYLETHPNGSLEQMLAEGYTPGGEFNWNNETQQMIMSWYMIAYTLPQLLLAKLGTMLGCRLMVSIFLSLCALSTLLTPLCAPLGWQYVLAMRLLNGFGASPTWPMFIHLLEKWLPQEEHPLGLGIGQSLSVLFVAANPLLMGYLSAIHWSWAFYVPGGLALIFCLLWFLLVTNEPEQNFLVSKQELRIFSSKNTGQLEQKKQQQQQQQQQLPWTAIFGQPSLYALLVLWSLHCSSLDVFHYILPTYLVQFLHIKVTQTGIYCALILTGCILAVIWPHPLLCLLKKEPLKLSDCAARRTVLGACCLTVASTWSSVGLFHANQLLLLFLSRCTQNGIDVIVISTLMIEYSEVGLSALAFGMINMVANFTIVFSSTFVGWFLDFSGQSRACWTTILCTLGLAQVAIFVLFVALVPTRPLSFGAGERKVEEAAEVRVRVTSASK